MNNNPRKDSANVSTTSFSTMNSVQQKYQPSVVTGSALTVRQRSPTKHSWNRHRTKSNMTVITNPSSIQSARKTRFVNLI